MTALICLIGLPGSGKSTIGRHLARHFLAAYLDSDQEIEKCVGCTILEYFEREGEASFRDVEQSTLAELISASLSTSSKLQVSAECNTVLSTGGGAVLRPANRQALRQSGQVVYLHSQPDDIFKRLRHDRNRPLLQVGDPLQRLRDLYAVRDPLYRETAHFVVETGRPSVATLVNMIVMQLELAGTQK